VSREASSASGFERFGLPTRESRVAVAIVFGFVLASALWIDSAGVALIAAKNWVVGYFGWLFVVLASGCLLGVVILGLHPRGRMRLGPPGSEPEFSRMAWFSMLFSAGLAAGLLYWATAEPIIHFQSNPFIEAEGDAGSTQAAVRTAMRITVMHWGLHGWAFYVVGALGILVYSGRFGLPLSFRTALYPVLGARHLDRWPGKAVELVALFGTVCGVATSIGISAAAMNATLGSLVGLGMGLTNQMGIVVAVCGLGIWSARSGVARGIRRLSELNVWMSLLLLFGFLALGPAGFVVELIFATAWDYALQVVPTGLWLAQTPEHQSWQADWTIFYWGWWLAWTPFVSLFIARISRGRSLREFVLAVMGVPSLVIVVWMSIVGGTSLHQELTQAGAVAEAVNRDYSLGIVAVIENLADPGVAILLTGFAAFLLFTWLITSLDSATLVIGHMVGAADAPRPKTFWGIVLAAVTCVLMRADGLPALQAASIVVGLPLAVLVGVILVALVWDLARGHLEATPLE
jgi:choline/glycine/proline betaine transport protein